MTPVYATLLRYSMGQRLFGYDTGIRSSRVALFDEPTSFWLVFLTGPHRAPTVFCLVFIDNFSSALMRHVTDIRPLVIRLNVEFHQKHVVSYILIIFSFTITCLSVRVCVYMCIILRKPSLKEAWYSFGKLITLVSIYTFDVPSVVIGRLE